MVKELEKTQNIRVGYIEDDRFRPKVVQAHRFGGLVDKLYLLIDDVEKTDDGIYKIGFRNDIYWQHDLPWKENSCYSDHSALEITFRAATQVAARRKLGEEIPHAELLTLQKETRWITLKANPNAKDQLISVKASRALAKNPDELKEELKKSRWKLGRVGPSIATLTALTTAACTAAANPPAIVAPAPEDQESIKPMPEAIPSTLNASATSTPEQAIIPETGNDNAPTLGAQLGTDIANHEATQTAEAAATQVEPTSAIPAWSIAEVDIDGDSNPDKVVQFSNGEKFPLLGDDAYVREDTLMVLDQETNSWVESAHIYTIEELVQQAPSEQEMRDFLKSSEIIRSTNSKGNINPLGVRGIRQIADWTTRGLQAIIWDYPELVWLETGEEPVLSAVVPIVTTAGSNNIENPEFLYMWLGEERVAWVGLNSDLMGIYNEDRGRGGKHRSYVLKIEEVSEAFIRGHQFFTDISYEASGEKLKELGKDQRKVVKSQHNFLLSNSKNVKSTLDNLASGSSVPPGTVVGPTGEIMLTKTATWEIKLTTPTPPPDS